MTEPQTWHVAQEFYDQLMALPAGTDITDLVELRFEDPQWQGFRVFTGGPVGAEPDTAGRDETG